MNLKKRGQEFTFKHTILALDTYIMFSRQTSDSPLSVPMSDAFDESPMSLSAENILLDIEFSCVSSSLSLGSFKSGVRVKGAPAGFRKRSGVLDRKSRAIHAEPGKHLSTNKQRLRLLSIESPSELAGELGRPLGIGFSGVELILNPLEWFD